VSGGSGSFSYAWEAVGFPNYTWGIGSPSSPTTTFNCTLPYGQSDSNAFQCKVTDLVTGISVYSNEVSADVMRT
jgi:hypothetical protein